MNIFKLSYLFMKLIHLKTYIMPHEVNYALQYQCMHLSRPKYELMKSISLLIIGY